MILVDTSAWIEFIRDSDDPVTGQLHQMISRGADLRTTEPVIMELLAGADTPRRHHVISQLTNGLPLLAIDPLVDYTSAATLFVEARKSGRIIRSLNDCLIASVAIRTGAALFHRDRDFDQLAKVTTLSLYSP
jgi:predicted nucleic acid-binding protein